MSEEANKQINKDIEKQARNDKGPTSENNEPFEEIKQKPPPGINASLVLFYAIFFSMFAVGWINLNSCPINILIPIYLIVAGFFGALAKFLSKIENKYLHQITAVLIIFNCVWHVLGTYWVFKEYQPNYEVKLGKYCDRTTYLMAFWVLIFEYTLLGFFILLSGCYMMMRGDFKKK